jgi:hypothetical protein
LDECERKIKRKIKEKKKKRKEAFIKNEFKNHNIYIK